MTKNSFMSHINRELGSTLATSTDGRLIFQTQRYGHWFFQKEGPEYPFRLTVYPFRVYEYVPGIIRMTNAGKDHFGYGRKLRWDILEKIPDNGGLWFEISFLPEELGAVTDLVTKHIDRPLVTAPDWLEYRYGGSIAISIGRPFRDYWWTTKARKAYARRHKKRS